MTSLREFEEAEATSVLARYCSELSELAAVVTDILGQVVDNWSSLDDDIVTVRRADAAVQRLAQTFNTVLRREAILDARTAGAPTAAPTAGASAKAATPGKRARPAAGNAESEGIRVWAMPSVGRCVEVMVGALQGDDRARQLMGGKRTIQGSTHSMPIQTVFELLSRTRKSGTLRVGTPVESLTFEFVRGDVVCTSTDNPPAEQRLGDVLFAMGFVEPNELREFLERYRDSSLQMGEALLREELLTKEQLVAALEFQVQQRFYRAFSAEEATYEFVEGERAPADDRIRMNVTELLFESAKVKDERTRA